MSASSTSAGDAHTDPTVITGHVDTARMQTNQPDADALVLFGATGDLAVRKLFPALYRLERSGTLQVPVIGVARSEWTDDDFRRHARESIAEHIDDPDPAVVDSLCARLDLVQGDYADENTWNGLRAALDAVNSLVAVFYMAIPPNMFPLVAKKLASVDLHHRGRIVVEKPFGRDLAVGDRVEQDAARGVRRGPHLPHRPLPRQGGRRGPAGVPLRQHAARAGVEPQLRPQRAGDDVGDARRRGPRLVLRGRRRDPRRVPEPPAAGGVAAGDGAARRRRLGLPAGREGQGDRGDASDRARRAGARPVRRLPRRARRRSALERRDLRWRRDSRSTRGGGPACRGTSASARRWRRARPKQ